MILALASQIPAFIEAYFLLPSLSVSFTLAQFSFVFSDHLYEALYKKWDCSQVGGTRNKRGQSVLDPEESQSRMGDRHAQTQLLDQKRCDQPHREVAPDSVGTTARSEFHTARENPGGVLSW